MDSKLGPTFSGGKLRLKQEKQGKTKISYPQIKQIDFYCNGKIPVF